MEKHYNDDKIEFRQIVLNYVRKIIDLNLRIDDDEGGVSFVKSYKRSVLGLSDILIPFFDSKMTASSKTFDKAIEEMTPKSEENQDINNYSKYIQDTMNHSRKLFQALNLLLKRNDYLKSSIYGEEKDEAVSEEEKE